MDTQILKLFLEVAQQGSFATAARRLKLDPSKVSRDIAHLEQQLKLRLFKRTTRHLTLTEAGDVYKQHLIPIMEALDEAHHTAQNLTQHVHGRVKLTCSVAFGQIKLLPILPKFQNQYPDVSLDIKLSDSIVDLQTEDIDLAIRLLPGYQADELHLIGAPLFSTEYFVCVNPEYMANNKPIKRPEDLQHHACITMDLYPYSSRWKFKNQRQPIETIKIQSKLSISSPLALKECVLMGMGPTLIADWLVEKPLKDGSLIRLLPDYNITATDFDTAAWLLYPSRHFLPAKVQVMIQYLKDHLK